MFLFLSIVGFILLCALAVHIVNLPYKHPEVIQAHKQKEVLEKCMKRAASIAERRMRQAQFFKYREMMRQDLRTAIFLSDSFNPSVLDVGNMEGDYFDKDQAKAIIYYYLCDFPSEKGIDKNEVIESLTYASLDFMSLEEARMYILDPDEYEKQPKKKLTVRDYFAYPESNFLNF